MKQKIALVRGKYLNRYEMQSYEPLASTYDITAFGSQTSYHANFTFPTVKLVSPLDLPDFPYKMQILNRLYHDAQFLYGLERSLKGFAIAHTAETYFHLTHQALVAKKKGYVKKVIVTEWENIPFNNEGIRGRTALKQYCLQHADHFIAVSQQTKYALLLEGADEEKISVISPGIDTTVFTPEANNKNKKQETKNNMIRLLFVGRMVRNKGIYELLYAFALLAKDKQLQKLHIQLLFVGSGEDEHQLRLLIRKLHLQEKVTISSVTYDAIPETYHHTDIFVAPSKGDTYWQEQWGMALMEAQASGLPIVTTYSGSIPENVGDAALLVQPGDTVSLFLALKRLILDSELRFNLGEKARSRAEKVHDCEHAARKIAKVYDHLLGIRD